MAKIRIPSRILVIESRGHLLPHHVPNLDTFSDSNCLIAGSGQLMGRPIDGCGETIYIAQLRLSARSRPALVHIDFHPCLLRVKCSCHRASESVLAQMQSLAFHFSRTSPKKSLDR